jgi:hypothetical protein
VRYVYGVGEGVGATVVVVASLLGECPQWGDRRRVIYSIPAFPTTFFVITIFRPNLSMETTASSSKLTLNAAMKNAIAPKNGP